MVRDLHGRFALVQGGVHEQHRLCGGCGRRSGEVHGWIHHSGGERERSLRMGIDAEPHQRSGAHTVRCATEKRQRPRYEGRAGLVRYCDRS
ncbi:MAG: DUF1289 domain-containing protein [Flavobacteriales bacterium]|nr:DUF1289 domain-containing protein [Flavobacteriales bacterium]